MLNKHFPKDKVYLHGTYSSILGCKEDDANSLDYLLNMVENTQAHSMILGGVSLTDFAHYKLGDMRFYFSPLHQLEPLTSEKLIARKKLNHFFKN